jgi:hypothetical protein
VCRGVRRECCLSVKGARPLPRRGRRVGAGRSVSKWTGFVWKGTAAGWATTGCEGWTRREIGLGRRRGRSAGIGGRGGGVTRRGASNLMHALPRLHGWGRGGWRGSSADTRADKTTAYRSLFDRFDRFDRGRLASAQAAPLVALRSPVSRRLLRGARVRGGPPHPLTTLRLAISALGRLPAADRRAAGV